MEPWFVKTLFFQALYILLRSAGWMGWNFFLAVIPFVLSLVLFRQTLKQRHRSLLWWLGVAVFVAFLPNAPYILTDIIHFVRHVQQGASIWLITLVLVPLYVVFLTAGFEAYMLSLMNVESYLHRHGLVRYAPPIVMALHGLSAIGIYLGRFLRFNSWDLVTRLHAVVGSVARDLTETEAIIAMVVTFTVLAGLYALAKPLNLALFTYLKRRKLKRPRLLEG
jgi:uncharacterized membrane protein